MIRGRTPAATFRRRLPMPTAWLLVAAAGALLIGHPLSVRAATGDFEVNRSVGADGAAYLLRGGLQTSRSSCLVRHS